MPVPMRVAREMLWWCVRNAGSAGRRHQTAKPKGRQRMTRTLALLAAAAATALPVLAGAQTAGGGLTGNVTLTSDYRFRGLSQSFKQPAIQGGFDWTTPGGLYLGNWNSSVSGNQFPNGASLEMDFYGGYRFEAGRNLTLDVGGLYYYYPGASYAGLPGEKFDNFELYVGAASGALSAKLFYAVTDFFGLNATTGAALGGRGSSGSYYVDLNYVGELAPGAALVLHAGYQDVRNYGALDYWDYKIGLTYDWTGWQLGAAVVGTNADKALYTVVDGNGRSKTIGDTTFVMSIGRTF
jgi:uncharacterized protein (TIGR02001 family)